MSSDGGRDYHAWAKFPASHIAFAEAKKLADSGDFEFKAIMDDHIKSGICTDEGRLLKVWKSQQWISS